MMRKLLLMACFATLTTTFAWAQEQDPPPSDEDLTSIVA